MKLKIHFKLSGKRQLLPMNYQYPFSAWIYKVINKADRQFAQMLHENGYKTEKGKQFKLFTFSKLRFPKHTWKTTPKSDRMEVWARNAHITVSFQLPEQIEKFVMGLFKEQKAFIGDKVSGIEMEVGNIESIGQEGVFGHDEQDGQDIVSVNLKTETAIVLGVYVEGKKHEQYVPPLHPEYKQLFLQSLIDKYEATGQKGVSIDDMDFIVGKISIKTSMQTIKAFTPAETKVRGYNYEFGLTAPKGVIEVGLNSGFGNMCSLGFGMCEVLYYK